MNSVRLFEQRAALLAAYGVGPVKDVTPATPPTPTTFHVEQQTELSELDVSPSPERSLRELLIAAEVIPK